MLKTVLQDISRVLMGFAKFQFLVNQFEKLKIENRLFIK